MLTISNISGVVTLFADGIVIWQGTIGQFSDAVARVKVTP